MPEERVELSWGCPRRILSPLRLPFRHSGRSQRAKYTFRRSAAVGQRGGRTIKHAAATEQRVAAAHQRNGERFRSAGAAARGLHVPSPGLSPSPALRGAPSASPRPAASLLALRTQPLGLGRIAPLLHAVSLLGCQTRGEQDGETEDYEFVHSSLRGTQQCTKLLRVEFVEVSAALWYSHAVAGDDLI